MVHSSCVSSSIGRFFIFGDEVSNKNSVDLFDDPINGTVNGTVDGTVDGTVNGTINGTNVDSISESSFSSDDDDDDDDDDEDMLKSFRCWFIYDCGSIL